MILIHNAGENVSYYREKNPDMNILSIPVKENFSNTPVQL